MSFLLLHAIRFYQRFLSPLTGNCCRFEPSCSRYGHICIEHLGPWRGSWLALKRILRCNPLFSGGYDPPPLPPGAPLELREPDWERISRLYSVVADDEHSLRR